MRLCYNGQYEVIVLKIAVTFEGGAIGREFADCPQVKIYTDEYREITDTELVDNPKGDAALADKLSKLGVEVVICDQISEDGIEALDSKNIMIYSGNAGNPDDAVNAFLQCRLDNKSNGIDTECVRK